MCGYQNHRDMAGFAHLFLKLQPIHFRHAHIADDDFRLTGLKKFQPFRAAFCKHNLIARAFQQMRQGHAHFAVVIHHQDLWLVHVASSLCFFVLRLMGLL